MFVRMKGAITSADWSLHHGQIAEVSDEVGRAWIAADMAEASDATGAHVVHESAAPVEEAAPMATGDAAAVAEHEPALWPPVDVASEA